MHLPSLSCHLKGRKQWKIAPSGSVQLFVMLAKSTDARFVLVDPFLSVARLESERLTPSFASIAPARLIALAHPDFRDDLARNGLLSEASPV